MNNRKKRRVTVKRKRILDPNITIDYKYPDILNRFITDRGKIIPRRISGANAEQQRQICKAIKRARYLGLIPFTVAHRQEKNPAVEAALQAASTVTARARRAQQQYQKPSATDYNKDNKIIDNPEDKGNE